ncbi:tRNA synthetases class II (A) [Thiothrix eikelboomii]|uniref:Alanine--tRNA ligase n=1 Tax=Thiothrix eikelboomii TaxID=92487 RepID=A0A1T4X9D4_9GAMM|nr:alanine--tRNA ligase-related protein [Thiothrix eikelboomii]SKA86212.1 tRNA synthetases class II (A) [Thiothrix eikelboomii]
MTGLAETHLTTVQAISSAFELNFAQQGFSVLQPSSLLHKSVPHSFVMSAGLVQIENELVRIRHEYGDRFVFTQPCFRYFDMAAVGKDSTHLSLFHMSAAFHVGSSARETVLPYLWQFLTEVLQLDPARLWISYLDDKTLGKDQASYQCWRDLGVTEQRLVGLSAESNFWRQKTAGQVMLDGKKCGPHTEVFYERPEIACQHPQNCGLTCDCGRFVEIANSLFIEKYLNEEGGLIDNPEPFAETVIGNERLAMLQQQLADIHQLHEFQPYRSILLDLLQRQHPHDWAFYLPNIHVIQDHLLAFVTLVEHGAPAPGQSGRARIMRKLARAAIGNMVVIKLDSLLLEQVLFEDKQAKALQYLLEEYRKLMKVLENAKSKLDDCIKINPTTELIMKKKLLAQHGVPKVLIDYDPMWEL